VAFSLEISFLARDLESLGFDGFEGLEIGMISSGRMVWGRVSLIGS